MKKYLSLSLFLISFISAYSQSYFKEGYIITTTNDTIRGLIDYKTDVVNAASCKFKEDINAQVRDYSPSDINGYAIPQESKYYISHFIEIDNLQRKVFLEVLFRGVVNLYFYAESGISNYYFLKDTRKSNDDLSVMRVYTSRIISDQIEYKAIQNELFKNKGVLRFVFQDAPSINDEINKMGFDQKEVIALTKKYHKLISGEDSEFAMPEKKEKNNDTLFRFAGYAGVSFSNHSFDDYKMGQFSSMDVVSPVVGVQLSINVPRFSRGLSAVVDASFTKLSGDKETTLEGLEMVRKYEYDLTLLSTKAGISYTFTDNKLRPVLDAGGLFRFSLSRSSKLTERNLMINRVTEHKDYRNPESLFYGFYVGAGLDYRLTHKYSLIAKVKYEYTTASKDEKLNSVVVTVGFGF